jgi:single-stranded DNA-binding protein
MDYVLWRAAVTQPPKYRTKLSKGVTVASVCLTTQKYGKKQHKKRHQKVELKSVTIKTVLYLNEKILSK